MSEVLEMVGAVCSEAWSHADSVHAVIGTVAVSAGLFAVSVFRPIAVVPEEFYAPGRRAGLRTIAVAMLFALVTVQIERGGWLTRADPFVSSWFARHRTGTSTAVAGTVNRLSDPRIVIAETVVVATILVCTRRRSAAALITAPVVLVFVTGWCVKLLADHEQPGGTWLGVLNAGTFPGAPIGGVTALVGALAMMCAGVDGRSSRQAAVIWSLVVASVGVVGVAALSAGTHRATDAAAGALAGVAAVSVIAIVRASGVNRALPDHADTVAQSVSR
ncbi:hypothetical protein [Nocardia sp. NPDC056100]|uniref:hypothetical protein n=1 Tax=Nocardia sp. NPDC056100 TaxID=3345712 RepID=UPI0035E295D1